MGRLPEVILKTSSLTFPSFLVFMYFSMVKNREILIQDLCPSPVASHIIKLIIGSVEMSATHLMFCSDTGSIAHSKDEADVS